MDLIKPANRFVFSSDDFYAEQLLVDIIGPNTFITSRSITNSTNLFPTFNFDDDILRNATIFVSCSNGIHENITNSIYNTDNQSRSLRGQNEVVGFIYFSKENEEAIVSQNVNFILDNLKSLLQIDLFGFPDPEYYSDKWGYFYPFYSAEPDWQSLLSDFTKFIPKDGYFQEEIISRVFDPSYSSQNFLATQFFHLSSISDIEKIQFAIQKVDFFEDFLNLNNSLVSFPFAYDVSDMFEEYLGIMNESLGVLNQSVFESLLQNPFLDPLTELQGNVTQDDLDVFLNSISLFQIEFEGFGNGVKLYKNGTYEFDLQKAIGSPHIEFLPSRSIFGNPLGLFFSGIGISTYCSDIISMNPDYFPISTDIINYVKYYEYYSQEDQDLEILDDLVWKPYWLSGGYKVKMMGNLFDIGRKGGEYEVLNHLFVMGINGSSIIPTAIFKPPENIQVYFEISDELPILDIEQDVQNVIPGIGITTLPREIEIINSGTVDAWGVLPDTPPQDLPVELGATFGFPVPSLKTTLENIPVAIKSGILEFFGEDDIMDLAGTEDFRVFMIDIDDNGVIDQFYPNVFDPIGGSLPYNPEVADWLRSPQAEEYTGLNSLILEYYSTFFDNPLSIYNPDNYRLEPGDSIDISTLFDLTPYRSFFPFQNLTALIDDTFPKVVYGVNYSETPVENILVQDGNVWNVSSVQVGSEHLISLYFSFQNITNVSLEQTIDQFSINYWGSNLNPIDGDILLRIYNWIGDDFVDFNWDIDQTEANQQQTLSFGDSELTGAEIFVNETGNYTVWANLVIKSSNPINMSIDSLDMTINELNKTMCPVGPVSVFYSTENGKVRREVLSNQITVATKDIPSIKPVIDLDNKYSSPGSQNGIKLSLYNKGTQSARNITVKFRAPGIVTDVGDFYKEGDYLYFKLSTLQKTHQIVNLEIQFLTPNSLYIAPLEVTWVDSEGLEFRSYSNPLYIHAPSTFLNSTSIPKNLIIRTEYLPLESIPRIGEQFFVKLLVTNVGDEIIRDLEVRFPTNIVGLELLSSSENEITGLHPNTNTTIEFLFRKNSREGYFLPSKCVLSGIDSPLTRFYGKSPPLIIGTVNLSISKSRMGENSYQNQNSIIKILVRNTGTVPLYDFVVSDSSSYSSQDIELMSGQLESKIKFLDVGESVSFNYSIHFSNTGRIKSDKVFSRYLFHHFQTFESPPIYVNVRLNPITTVIVSITIATISIGIGILIYTFFRGHKEDISISKFNNITGGEAVR